MFRGFFRNFNLFSKKRCKKRESFGFSLPDILIVMGLVSIAAFSIIVLVDPGNIRRRNRDILRVEYLDSLNRAIYLSLMEGEIFLRDTKECSLCNSLDGSIAVDGTGWVKVYTSPGRKGLGTYLDSLPIDPINKSPQVFMFVSTDNQGYKLAVQLESVENQIRMRVDGGIYDKLYEIGTDLSLEFK